MRLLSSALLIFFGWALADAPGMLPQIPAYLKWTMGVAGVAMIGGGIYLWLTSGPRRGRKESSAGDE